jgi:hypothetical protein
MLKVHAIVACRIAASSGSPGLTAAAGPAPRWDGLTASGCAGYSPRLVFTAFSIASPRPTLCEAKPGLHMTT